MSQEQGVPSPSVVDEDPVRAIRNSMERLELLVRTASTVASLRRNFEEEKLLVERALQRLQPS